MSEDKRSGLSGGDHAFREGQERGTREFVTVFLQMGSFRKREGSDSTPRRTTNEDIAATEIHSPSHRFYILTGHVMIDGWPVGTADIRNE